MIKNKRGTINPIEIFKEYLRWYKENENTIENSNRVLFEHLRSWIAGFYEGYDIGFRHGYEKPNLNTEEATLIINKIIK